VELSKPVDISSIKSAFMGPTIISPAIWFGKKLNVCIKEKMFLTNI
jgi:hypothetical protein